MNRRYGDAYQRRCEPRRNVELRSALITQSKRHSVINIGGSNAKVLNLSNIQTLEERNESQEQGCSRDCDKHHATTMFELQIRCRLPVRARYGTSMRLSSHPRNTVPRQCLRETSCHDVDTARAPDTILSACTRVARDVHATIIASELDIGCNFDYPNTHHRPHIRPRAAIHSSLQIDVRTIRRGANGAYEYDSRMSVSRPLTPEVRAILALQKTS